MASHWDLTALVNAADPKAGQAERHLWLARLMEWLRRPPRRAERKKAPADGENGNGAAGEPGAGPDERSRTPRPLLKLRQLLNMCERNPEVRARVQALVAAFWTEIDAAALFADFGHGARQSLAADVFDRLRRRVLPGTPETRDLAELFRLLFQPADAHWLAAIDEPTLVRLAALLATPDSAWRRPAIEALTILASAVHSAGYDASLRTRMTRERIANDPFRQLAICSEAMRSALLEGNQVEALRQATWMRTLLAACRAAAASVTDHLETHGVSVNIVYAMEQIDARTQRMERLLDCLLARDARPELLRLMRELVELRRAEDGVRDTLVRHHRQLTRIVAERNAEIGSHYITRTRAEYRDMLRRAAGGGAVIAGTTFLKFAIAALGLSLFWTGFWSGVNYATSFVIVMLMHWTVATKQPAMTAPALAASLPRANGHDDATLDAVAERVAQLIRSQVAGIVGNLAACAPLVAAVQLAAIHAWGTPLVGDGSAHYVLGATSHLGWTMLHAAFTGVLLFTSSILAGWAENAFVFHRLGSAIAWNPRIVGRFGAARAHRWATWWRANISGLAANVSLGLMLGIVPALLAFFAIPLDVRHVTLSTGQVAAAAVAIGPDVLRDAAFWQSVGCIVVTGVLNVGVSFWLAFRVALAARGVPLAERARIRAAIRRRLLRDPLSFVRPPKLLA